MISKTHISAQQPRGRQLNVKVCGSESAIFLILSSITAPQDAHKRLVLQVYLGLNTLEFSAIHRSFVSRLQVHCYLANWPEVEGGSKDQGFVLPNLPEAESLRVASFVASLSPREEPDISLSIVNSFDLLYTPHYTSIISPKHDSTLNTHSNDIIHTYIECVRSRKPKNCFGSRCEGWECCSWWWESCWCTKVSFLRQLYHAINNSDWMSNTSSSLCNNLFTSVDARHLGASLSKQ